jgi:hypothetical protein
VRSQSHGATYDSYLLKADVAAENRRTTRPRAVEPPVPEPVEEPVRSNETELPPQSRLRFREG